MAITPDGGRFTGTISGQGMSNSIEGTPIDSQIAWAIHLTTPMKLTMEFSGTISGDTMKGDVKAGMMGRFKFSGNRA